MKIKLIFAIATGFFAVATVFNMNVLQGNSAGDVSLDAITVMARANWEWDDNPLRTIRYDFQNGRGMLVEYQGNTGDKSYWIGGSAMRSSESRNQSYTTFNNGRSISTNGRVIAVSSNTGLSHNSGTLSRVEHRCGWSLSGTCNRAYERDVYIF